MKEFTLEERKIIEKMHLLKKSYRSIGRVLKRPHTSIRYEIRINSSHNIYLSEEAQRMHYLRIMKRGNKSKIDQNPELKSKIIEYLKEEWSPESVAGYINRFDQEELECTITHETIYQYIYRENNKEQRLFLYLMRHRPKRIKRFSRKNNKKIKIPDRTSIHERPNEINMRTELGHWEGDSMIFSKQKEILAVQVERVSKLTRINICENKTADETLNAIMKTIDDINPRYFKSITFDNGTEFTKHTVLKEHWDIQTYFCDAYCSWQKGLVENTNMFLRRYLPRDIKLNQITPQILYEIQEKLNNRPRKCLNWLSPNQYFYMLSTQVVK